MCSREPDKEGQQLEEERRPPSKRSSNAGCFLCGATTCRNSQQNTPVLATAKTASGASQHTDRDFQTVTVTTRPTLPTTKTAGYDNPIASGLAQRPIEASAMTSSQPFDGKGNQCQRNEKIGRVRLDLARMPNRCERNRKERNSDHGASPLSNRPAT